VISSDSDYSIVMSKIGKLMGKGSENVSIDELEAIKQLALAAQNYEQRKYGLPVTDGATY
jgi:HTH-type transcriptional regulator/antitoxin HigA